MYYSNCDKLSNPTVLRHVENTFFIGRFIQENKSTKTSN